MQIKSLNYYAYFGTAGNNERATLSLDMIMDDDLFTKLTSYGSGATILQHYEDLQETNPIGKINTYLGAPVINNKVHFYTVVGNGNPAISSDEYADCNKMYAFLGLNHTYLLMQNVVNANPTYYMYKADLIASPVISLNAQSNRFRAIRETLGNVYEVDSSNTDYTYVECHDETRNITIWVNILPTDYFKNGVYNAEKYQNALFPQLQLAINFNNTYEYATEIYIIVRNNTDSFNVNIKNFLTNAFNENTVYGETIYDMSNPYGEDGTSTTGGGDGTLPAGGEGLDFVDPTDIPELPTLSSVATGFITMYNPTSGQLSLLGDFLWSGQFDLDTYKKLFADPMQGIIGLGIVPCLPSVLGTKNIKFGNVDTGVNCNYLASQYATVNCGSVNIQKYVGSFMDYSPYVKISMFLPYIGFVNLGTDDIMGGSINVVYHIDVLTGDCVAFIKHNTKGVLYAYHGNCLTNVPVSGQNYANALKNYYESVSGIIPATTNGATGGPAGAIGGAIAGTLQSASNVILNSKPTFQRSGNIGGSAGIMGVQKPFLIIERPNISVPDNVQHFAGQTCNITANLGACTGFTVVDSVHLNGISATTQELKEIESLLKGGVIL